MGVGHALADATPNIRHRFSFVGELKAESAFRKPIPVRRKLGHEMAEGFGWHIITGCQIAAAQGVIVAVQERGNALRIKDRAQMVGGRGGRMLMLRRAGWM